MTCVGKEGERDGKGGMGEEEEKNRRKERKEKERNMTGPRYGGGETSFINMWEGIARGRVQSGHDPEPCEERGEGKKSGREREPGTSALRPKGSII